MNGQSSRPSLYGDLCAWALIAADSLSLLASLPDTCIDAVVTDPPYGLAFKDEHWDGGKLASPLGFQDFSRAWAREARRVLRPGGYLVAFGAPRTFHRLVAGCEDAGLEVRDLLLWLHGAGVPKSLRLAAGLGTSLKPAYEPILLARAPLDPGTTISNIARHGTGGLNIDALRLPRGTGGAFDDRGEGYWPSQIVLSHEDGCGPSALSCASECVVPLIDQLAEQSQPISRLFYAAKASRAEREAGLGVLPRSAEPIFSSSKQLARPRANIHPTVKPLGVMRWLVRLVAPPGGVVLDPFAGSGTTGCAALLERRQFIGIEREPRFVPIARARLAQWARVARHDLSGDV